MFNTEILYVFCVASPDRKFVIPSLSALMTFAELIN